MTSLNVPVGLRPLYPPDPTVWSEWLAVPGGHEIHVQQSGSPEGLPVVVLHGGPGSGLSPLLRRFLDPQRFRIVGIDQRGAGLSRPPGRVDENTLSDLLADLRHVRTHLALERWLVVGGSWGATLAVAHALDEPEAVAGLLLRGLFLARRVDIDAFFEGWASPDTLFRALVSDDLAVARQTALQWWRREQALAGSALASEPDEWALDALVVRYRLQSHYLRHGCWLGEAPLLERAAALPNVPTLLLHGRLDRICPSEGAAAFHAAVPHSRLRWIDGAGHDPMHPGMIDAMVTALDTWAATQHFSESGALR